MRCNADFEDGVKSEFPNVVCNDPKLALVFSGLVDPQCEEIFLAATKICLKTHEEQIPEILNQPADGKYWGTIIGECASSVFRVVQSFKNVKGEDIE